MGTGLEERFEKSINNVRTTINLYKSIGLAGRVAVALIQQDINLYEAGDRSEALLKSLEGFK